MLTLKQLNRMVLDVSCFTSTLFHVTVSSCFCTNMAVYTSDSYVDTYMFQHIIMGCTIGV